MAKNVWFLILTVLGWGLTASAKNPLFFGADPSGLAAPDGRMWIYPTTDEPNWDDQVDWHAWSSSDLVNWTDHGVIFSMKDSGWATKFAWAPDCAYKKGKYYFYYYFNKGKPGGGVGVAVSDRPEGPFKEALGHRLVEGHDPRIFVDDDGQAYLYVQDVAYKLNEDMISLKSEQINLEIDYRPKPFEAVYVFKRHGIYYYTIAAEFNRLIYYMGDNPLGPFKHQGEIMAKYGGNNHHSVVEYGGKWILWYHGWAPGRHRMVRGEYLKFNADGTIQTTAITEEGVGPLSGAPASGAKQAPASGSGPAIYVNDLSVHDPFIFPDAKTRRYIIYKSFAPGRGGGAGSGVGQRAGVMAYTSKDLVRWDGPQVVFEMAEGFWADGDSGPWAPEVHEYKGKYYLCTTFNAWGEELEKREGRPFINKRASQILVGETPLGPFKAFGNKPHTPAGEMTLDATFWVENGQPWLIYCHEWVQINEGLIKAIRLKDDLSETVGEAMTILNAADFPWTKRVIDYKGGVWPGRVTDGPEFYRLKSGALAMLWSSHTPERAYAQAAAYSPSGRLAGPWKHPAEPILQDDRGHGMVFRAFDGRLLLVLHRYFQAPKTRVQIYEVEDTGEELRVGKQILGAP